MRTITLAAGLLALIWPSAFLAADLNAPIQNTPTLGSEIHRGIGAATDCYFLHDNNFDPLSYTGCVTRADSKNTQAQAAYRPFSLGLHFQAWLWEDIEIQMYHGDPHKVFAKRLAEQAGQYAPLEFAIFRRIQMELGVSDGQLMAVTDLTAAGKNETLARIAYWSKVGKTN